MQKNTITSVDVIPKPLKSRRIWELDFIRGLCVLLMIWDHLMFDIWSVFGPEWIQESAIHEKAYDFALKYWDSGIRDIFHPIIFCVFFVLCGISCSLSRNNLTRGIQAVILALAVTLVTSLFGETAIIRFGVLHMLAFSIIFWCIIDFVARHNKIATSVLCLVIGLVIIIINGVYIENPPEELGYEFIGAWNHTNGYSADYFPLLPNVGYVLLGASVGPFWYKEKKSLLPALDKYNWHKPVGIWGRLALWVYILHQPIIIVLLSVTSYLFITPGNFIFI